MILVVGGTGFVGRAIVARLTQLGEKVRILARGLTKTPRRTENRVELFLGDASEPDTLDSALQGVVTVINLVGIIRPTRMQSFEKAHVDTVRNVVDAMKRANVQRLVHMSALGTRPYAASRYHQTKWEGEQIVRNSGLEWTIMRPGLIVGKGDGFVTTFVKLMRPPLSTIQLGTVPLFGGGTMIFQPVAVEEVAKCFARVISHADAVGSVFEICGREKITLKQMLEEIARALGANPSHLSANPELIPIYLLFAVFTKSKPILFDVPMAAAKALGLVMERLLPSPPLTYDQVLMLEEGSQGDPSRAENELGLQQLRFSDMLSYLRNL